MPDKLDAYERDLIAEALAAGRVTVCPPRTYAINLYETVDPREMQSRQFANLARAKRLREAEDRRKGSREFEHIERTFTASEREARREKVAALVDQGVSQRRIAARLGLSKSTVNEDVKFLQKQRKAA